MLLAITVNAQSSKIDIEVQNKLQTQQVVDCVIIFEYQADLSSSQQVKGKTEKATYVYEQLKMVATSTHYTEAFLQEEGIAYQRFFVVNSLRAKLNVTQINTIANFSEVSRIIQNGTFLMEKPVEIVADNTRMGVTNYGIKKIKADKVWEMGITGQGVIVGAQDTGYDWEHPALMMKYNGYDGITTDHNYSWHDAIHERNPNNSNDDNPCGFDTQAPCDDDAHGTHTMGTILGYYANGSDTNKIGIAPDAKFICARNMDRGWGLLSTYLECFEWFIAPTDLNGNNPDPSKSPHVINNSWGCVKEEGCDTSNLNILEVAVNNCKAAGIVVVVSNGNEGPGCRTTGNPAALYLNSFSVGSSDQNNNISGFSSRGPTRHGLSKPDVTAPGSQIMSSVPNNGYASYSGTSMAGPHVAGLVALIISANPNLAGEVDSIQEIIKSTCIKKFTFEGCGGNTSTSYPNNTYGYGIIDAKAAVDKALAILTGIPTYNIPGLLIYPNPSNGFLTIEGAGRDAHFELYYMDGKLEKSLIIQENQQINLQGLATGMYIYTIKNTEGQSSGKLVIEAE